MARARRELSRPASPVAGRRGLKVRAVRHRHHCARHGMRACRADDEGLTSHQHNVRDRERRTRGHSIVSPSLTPFPLLVAAKHVGSFAGKNSSSGVIRPRFDVASGVSRQTSQPGECSRWRRYVEEHRPDTARTANAVREFQAAPTSLIAASYISIARISAHTRDGNAT